MTLRGIDISSWQNGLDLNKVSVDFAIMKATESTNYVNPYCDNWVQQATKKNILWGVYHFASGTNAASEAKFFHDNCKGYIGKGIFILDFEIDIDNPVYWCETFMQKFHDLSNVWPLIYLSASRVNKFSESWIPKKCGLWLAGYPKSYSYFPNDDYPYTVSPWSTAAIWQFTSSLIIPGWYSKLDGNFAYMSSTGWLKYAGQSNADENSSIVQPVLNYKKLAAQIINGEWGNGKTREKKLKDAGYDYNTAQGMVNKYYAIASEVIAGYWGNGWNRKNALTGAGYDYDTVQKLVNEMI